MPGLKHHIIGLCGFAGAGKDTVADLLITHAGFRKLAFADALRAELNEAFRVEPLTFTRREYKGEALECLALSRCTDINYINAVLAHLAANADGAAFSASQELVTPRTPRQTMQWWGTQYRRANDPNYWTRQLTQRIAYYTRDLHERNFVITDCRFDNEVDALRAMGGWLWQVKRPGLDATTTPEGQHSSATDGTEFGPDEVLHNMHDIRHLQGVVLGEFWALDAGLENVKVEITT
jgi:hypothetical protein